MREEEKGKDEEGEGEEVDERAAPIPCGREPHGFVVAILLFSSAACPRRARRPPSHGPTKSS